MTAPTEQPLPTRNSSPSVQSMVIADLGSAFRSASSGTAPRSSRTTAGTPCGMRTKRRSTSAVNLRQLIAERDDPKIENEEEKA